jgi:hypothetical protein
LTPSGKPVCSGSNSIGISVSLPKMTNPGSDFREVKAIMTNLPVPVLAESPAEIVPTLATGSNSERLCEARESTEVVRESPADSRGGQNLSNEQFELPLELRPTYLMPSRPREGWSDERIGEELVVRQRNPDPEEHD